MNSFFDTGCDEVSCGEILGLPMLAAHGMQNIALLHYITLLQKNGPVSSFGSRWTSEGERVLETHRNIFLCRGI